MARALFEVERPLVGLLNVGVEEIKGQEEVKEAGRLLREAGLDTFDYYGFVEGDDLGKGTVDVVVTEGFTGNIALKTAEGPGIINFTDGTQRKVQLPLSFKGFAAALAASLAN